jgi:predicted nuclease of restriction endonuclease-like RecB superfamily
VGYWTPEYLAHKLKLYNQVFEESSARLVMAVSSYLNCAEGDFGGNVIRFKGALSAKDVLERLSTDKN